jgi:hypothetical protein
MNAAIPNSCPPFSDGRTNREEGKGALHNGLSWPVTANTPFHLTGIQAQWPAS